MSYDNLLDECEDPIDDISSSEPQTEPTPRGAALSVPEPTEAVTLGVIQASTPAALVRRATDAANALADVIETKKLCTLISGRRYVRCEGWTTLAAMLGFLAREEAVSRREDGSYEATVALVRITDTAVLTRASAECGLDEPTWKSRPAYARRSMAVTRATSKACRIAFSWVMVLAGYEVTPAEEVPPAVADEETPPSSGNPPDDPVWPSGSRKGELLRDAPDGFLTKARAWCVANDPPQHAELIRQIDQERRRRRQATLV
jgi:hypothetical protein